MTAILLERPIILIVDDDEQVRSLLTEMLGSEYKCATASSVDEAFALLQVLSFNVVLTDINLGSDSGLDLVPRILSQSPDTVVIVISGQQSIDFAIEAMRAGAFDYVVKPLDHRHLRVAVDRALKQHTLIKEKLQYENNLEDLVQQRTAEIEHLAYHDRLTDLPNRMLFADRCTQSISIAQRDHLELAVLLISLDNLSRVTDTLGHSAGDMVVIECAMRLRNCIGEGNTLARIDDEFAVLLTNTSQGSDVAEVSKLIGLAFKPPVRLESQDVYMTASIGISVFPSNGDDPATMLKNARAALYRARKNGGNTYQFYEGEMTALATKRLALETDLRRAVENEEFIVYYQPVISLFSGQVVGGEALVRWRHPELGILAPASFIGLAEANGLILDIGEMVLRAACAQARDWIERGAADFRIAVNISARQLRQKSFCTQVISILHETVLDPAHLELELTETTMLENTDSTIEFLNELRTLGVRVAIDDFGTGYSSLSYLKQLPIDALKLDRSFVSEATTDPKGAAMVMAIITLAHNLDLEVIAEGIETEEEKGFLRLMRCDEGQGYLFGKPMPAAVFAEQFIAAR
ncbi:MAG TPA: EAL domain-containing protein [Pyrinomonadaceae bacterium]|nr:EAL domain-containing protein [Pyrinomonadaceae bacterium]